VQMRPRLSGRHTGRWSRSWITTSRPRDVLSMAIPMCQRSRRRSVLQEPRSPTFPQPHPPPGTVGFPRSRAAKPAPDPPARAGSVRRRRGALAPPSRHIPAPAVDLRT
jgi:hypothetical protein